MNALLRRMLIFIPLLLLISCAAIGIYSAQDHFDYGLSYFKGAAIHQGSTLQTAVQQFQV